MMPKRQKDRENFIKQNSVASFEAAKQRISARSSIKRKNHLNLIDTTAFAT